MKVHKATLRTFSVRAPPLRFTQYDAGGPYELPATAGGAGAVTDLSRFPWSLNSRSPIDERCSWLPPPTLRVERDEWIREPPQEICQTKGRMKRSRLSDPARGHGAGAARGLRRSSRARRPSYWFCHSFPITLTAWHRCSWHLALLGGMERLHEKCYVYGGKEERHAQSG